MNIVQAIKNSARIVRDTSAPKEKRSVHLCWILHLTGDSHQPLHSVALYTTHRFRRGDHGGNYLDYQHSWDLHGFWDEQISTDDSYETHQVLAADLDRNRKLAEDGRKAAAKLEGDNWIDESMELAKRYASTNEVLAKVAAREGHSYLCRSTCRRTTRSMRSQSLNAVSSKPATGWPARFSRCCSNNCWRA
jgi:hypothetical protein